MRDDRARLLDAGSHQKGRPINGVETQNVLSDQMQRRPELFKADRTLLLLISESDRGDVVRQCLEPDVHRVLRIAGNRNAPTYRRIQATDREILQAATDETPHFVAPRVRLNKVRA